MGGGTGDGKIPERIYYRLKFTDDEGHPLRLGINPRSDKDLGRIVSTLTRGYLVSLEKISEKEYNRIK